MVLSFEIKLLQWTTLSVDLKPVGNSNEKSLGSEEATYIGNIVERRKKSIKSAWPGTQEETLNKLVNSVPNRLIEVIKNKEKAELNTERRGNRTNTEFIFFHSQRHNFKRKFNSFPDLERRKSLLVLSSIFFYIIIWNYINDPVNFYLII